MSIRYEEDNKIFHCSTKNSSYIMKIMDTGHLAHLYWGKKINNSNVDYILPLEEFGSFLANTDNISNFSLEAIPQEYPSYGNTDLRSPAYQIQLANGTTITDLRYTNHNIYKGKKRLEGLPSTYVENEDEAETLEIILKDSLIGLKVILSYSVFDKVDAIMRSVTYVNEGNESLNILKALSMNVDFSDKEYDVLQLSGAWARERHVIRKGIESGSHFIESKRGASGHHQNPFFALMRPESNEDHGEVYGFSLVYSGNFIANIEVDIYNNTRVQMGINHFDFSWLLECNQSFQTPEVVMVYSPEGLGKMSSNYHKLYRTRLVRGVYRDKERPILINNWEATYFNFTEDKVKSIAKTAKELGVELFVLDDGWFGKRDDDTTSLGDWFVDKNKIPNGLDKLSRDINSMGIKFGLWFEPEMISPNSELYRQHPDWCLHVPNRIRSQARKQLILDLSRKEVCDEVIERISKVLSSASISYVKWDMNRNMTEVGSATLPSERQRETAHRYMLGLYRIMDEITTRFPYILFESCSGGGGRFDPGILYYMPQTWTSDNTDAIERLMIQYGTSMCYPSIAMGAHVSDVPNHQVHRITPLETRGHVAMAGNLGYELDVTKMNDEEKQVIKEQIDFYKEIRNTVQFGDLYRLINPFEGNEAAWMYVSEDGREAVVSYVIKLAKPNYRTGRLKLKGLDPNRTYQLVGSDAKFDGDELMYVGLNLPRLLGDFKSYVWRFRVIN